MGPARRSALALLSLVGAPACDENSDETRLFGVTAGTGSAPGDARAPAAGAERDASVEPSSSATRCTRTGALRCQGVALQRCDEGLWQPVEVCATPRLCADSVTQCEILPAACEPEVRCLPPSCDQFDIRCSGHVAELCNEGRTGFDLLRDCGPPCGGARCQQGVGCTAEVCLADSFDCAGAGELLLCNDTCDAFVPVDCEPLGLCRFCDGHVEAAAPDAGG